MTDVKKIFNERNIRLAFDISLVLKGLFAFLETLSGLLTFFLTPQFILNMTRVITANELSEDPKDIIANYLLHQAEHISISAEHFAAIYLLGHGIVKLWLIVGLLRKRLWYYPTALIVFGLFICYQLYRYSLTHSPFLLFLTALDLIVIGLTWHEYQYLQDHLVR